MKKLSARKVCISAAFILLLWLPVMLHAQSAEPPAVGAPLVREGDFAIELSAALGTGQTDDEVEAESWLGEAGIAPRNGWIADYPVTPDVVGELQTSVGNAADAKKISMDRDEALRQFIAVCTQFGLSVTPYTSTARVPPPSCDNYSNPAVINEYYSDQGPPIVTYYCPPADYYYLYSYVPYPFWWSGFWFSGFFILNDFHRHHIGHNHVKFVSNHFNDVRRNKVFRVDPVKRFNGKTYAGIGARGTKNFVSTGVPKSDRNIFNAPRERMAPGMVTAPWVAPRKGSQPQGSRGTVSQQPRGSSQPAGREPIIQSPQVVTPRSERREPIIQSPQVVTPHSERREPVVQSPQVVIPHQGGREPVVQEPRGVSPHQGGREPVGRSPQGGGGFIR